MARLDRLGSAKELAQIGAAIGREFSHALLTSVVRQPEADMGSALDRLIQAGLLFRQGVPPHASYLFKHALVQDAAYGTLLREPRRALHARIAEALESQFAEIVESRPELLARHCTEAGLIDKAASLWGKAGQQSLTRSAPVEAEVQLRKGLTLLSGLPDDAPRQQQELEFQIALGRALMATKGHASAETGKAYIRARQLCERLNEPPQLVPVLFGQCVYHLVRGEYVLARQHAAAMRQLADARNDLRLRLMGCRLSGQPELFLGEFAAARAHLERGLALFDPEDRPFYGTLALQDARVMMLGNLSGALVPLGYLDQARARDDEALTDARRLAEPFTLAMALAPPAFLLWCAPPAVYLQRSEELATLAAEQHFPMSAAVGMVNRGWCMVALGQEKEGIDQATQGLVAFRATGARGNVPALLTLLADAYRMAGQPEAGLARLDEAEELIGETQERCIEAEMHRLRGELLKDTGDRALAEANFRKALGLAQRQSAKLFELRAVTSLARLWRDQGKHAEARDLLAPVYGWFTEGLDTPILKEAKALLDELAQ